MMDDWSTPHTLYRSVLTHRRFDAHAHRLRFTGFRLLLDLDRLAELPRRGVAYNRRGWLSFRDEDHGARDGRALREWIVTGLLRHGISCLPEWRIHLLAYPRVFGYGFNPLSLWYVRDDEDRARALLAEVHNTFGESHGYLLHGNGRPLSWPLRARVPKVFHVSPFFSLDGSYVFHLSPPTDSYTISIRLLDPEGRTRLLAQETGEIVPLDPRHLRRLALSPPFLAHRMMFTIHWRALTLFLRGAPFHHKPPPPARDWTVTVL